MAIFLYNNLGHFIMRDPVIKLRLHFVAGIGLSVLDIISDHSTRLIIFTLSHNYYNRLNRHINEDIIIISL